MSLDIVKKEVFRFLSSKKPEVLAIRGSWGTGKTYTWKNYLNDFHATEKSTCSRYAYVSLFGINSLEEFKFLLFQQSIPNDLIGQEPSLRSFKENAKSFSESFGRKGLSFLDRIPFVNGFSSEIRSLSFLAVTNTLICIDDLERKGKGLAMRDVLGLASQLREEKQCRIVFILNNGSLSAKDLKEYETFREKVIDVELEFLPTSKECADIALGSEVFENALKSKLLELDITNIRVIFRIKRLIELVIPYLDEYEEELEIQAIHTICLLGWCFITSDDESPNFMFVKEKGASLLGIDKKDVSDKEKSWRQLLQDYGYLFSDELDHALADVVERGYVVEAELREAAETINKQCKANKGDKSFEKAWRLYHDSFKDNQVEVVETIYSSFEENVLYISPLNLNGTVSLLRDLGRNDLADSCIEHYVKFRSDEVKLFDLDSYAFRGEIKDPKIEEAFNKHFNKATPQKTLREVVEGISGRNGWNPKDIEIMSNASEDDYYKLFKGEDGEHLHGFVKACLQFRNIHGTGEKEKLVSTKAEAALVRIAKESEINKRRVSNYGINVDDEK